MNMQFTHPWPVYGHDWAVEHLRKGIAHGRIRHAYLITGPESVGKNTLAHAFAMVLNCTHKVEHERPCGGCRSCKLILSGNHPDLLYSELDPNTGTLKIEEIRAVTGRIALKPYEARHRVAIFRDFDHAQPRAQDALLKTLEEPPPHAVLILLAQSAESLLPTITSRSQHLALRPVPAETIRDVLVHFWGTDSSQAELLGYLSGGRIGWAIQALQDSTLLEGRDQALAVLEQCLNLNRAGRFQLADELSKDKLSLVPLLELWQTYWRDVLLLSASGHQLPPANLDREENLSQLASALEPKDALAALRVTQETMRRLSTTVNVRLALEVMLLGYPGLARA